MRPVAGSPTRRQSLADYRWARQLHLWIGAWGAIAAILYGFTGLVMSNRFGDNPWPQGSSEDSSRLALSIPTSASDSPASLKGWLGETHGLYAQVVRIGKPIEARLAGKSVQEPAKWTLSGGTARSSWTVEFVQGNTTAEVKQTRHSPLGAFTRLHKGYGGGWAWSLLADSFGVGMILLGVSGIWMWARGRSLREMAGSVLALSTAVTAVVVVLAFG